MFCRSDSCGVDPEEILSNGAGSELEDMLRVMSAVRVEVFLCWSWLILFSDPSPCACLRWHIEELAFGVSS